MTMMMTMMIKISMMMVANGDDDGDDGDDADDVDENVACDNEDDAGAC